MSVVTRFAPSPTGMLHIGGARTALFNYLFARHHGGQFKLRIEDTDAARNSNASYRAILDGLAWLGVSYDGEPIYQSQRATRHKEVAEEMVKRGAAYYCYTTPEELAEQRAAAEAKGEQFRYDRKWRPADSSPPLAGGIEGGSAGSTPQGSGDGMRSPTQPSPACGGGLPVPPAGIAPSIRIKAPLTGDAAVHDAVQGDVRFPADALDDFVILRSDGTPTYMLAVVVDDFDMGVTHIVRGDDHLTNAGRQLLIYQAMGWPVPHYAHIPLIHGPDGKKLSKRHGAAAVTDYAAMGYLPEAMRNYLVRLGWSHGDAEIFSDDDAIQWFNLEAIGQAPSRLDFAKLNHVNAHYMRLKTGAELAALLNLSSDTLDIAAAIESVKAKASTMVELHEALGLYLAAPTAYDDKATATLAKGRDNLTLALPALEALGDWQAASIKQTITDLATSTGKKLGELMPPLRAAIVGAMSGPDIPDAMAILGKAESLARLKAAL